MNSKIYLAFLVIFSCQVEKKNNSHEIVENSIKALTAESQKKEFVDCETKDTLIRVGDFEYQIEKVDKENYEISWGGQKSKRKYPEKFPCWKKAEEEECDFTPKIEMMTKNEIVLRVTTSTPSAGNCSPIEYKMIYLPRNENEEEFEIEFYLKIENNYIVYSNSFDTVSVMNLTTKNNQHFALTPKPYFEFKTIDYSIDSIEIEERELRFKYLIGTDEDHGYVKRKMKLKI